MADMSSPAYRHIEWGTPMYRILWTCGNAETWDDDGKTHVITVPVHGTHDAWAIEARLNHVDGRPQCFTIDRMLYVMDSAWNAGY